MTHTMVTHLSFHFWMLVGIILCVLGYADLAIVAWLVPMTYIAIPYITYKKIRRRIADLESRPTPPPQ